ncbi:MAG: transposase [Pseudomonadota bacterium]
MEKLNKRKKIRIHKDCYKVEAKPCFITICTENKQKIFTNPKFTKEINTFLINYFTENKNPLYAYCIMPDHIHFLSSATAKKSIVDIVREFKSLSTRIAWKHNFNGKIWQRSFYDHFLRKEEIIEKVGMYILNNPVRAGLVAAWDDYRWSGSLEFSF